MPTPAIRRSVSVASWTAAVMPVALVVGAGLVAWRDAANRSATVDEIRLNRVETLRNREAGVRMQRELDEILGRPPPGPATRPATQP